MDFDLRQIAVPFRMQPGLRRLEAGRPQLSPLDASSRLHEEKRRVLEAGQSRHCVAGFDPGPALHAIREKAKSQGCGIDAIADAGIELAFEEDFAVLDGATTALPWLCVCVPSHWAPEEKLGLPFHAVHAPVADSSAIQAAAAQLVGLVTAGGCWERTVWTLSPSDRYDQHPRRHSRTPWPTTQDADGFADGCFLRAERQTFFPVGPGTLQAVFTIRVMLQPLVEAVATREHAVRLHDALRSMTDPVLAYKGIGQAREPLLRWLRERAA